MPDVSDASHIARSDLLTLAPGAPDGALPGCKGPLTVEVEHYYGGWSSDCQVSLSVDCQGAGCWWSRLVDGWSVTLPTLRMAQVLHDDAASEVARA